ncbi:hypothetical protein [Pedobacter cryoconitis]|uniref:Uncharacterized protein n=1 Tax=Pedobacter cryoconitis TaxID=188932 RepID=A0A7X0J793_9SPHI|nr:hypothetical protein [Pedobacter cryoconitis]MBB6502390.1 hypothetical protein [Pedobacter cryoconitis]
MLSEILQKKGQVNNNGWGGNMMGLALLKFDLLWLSFEFINPVRWFNKISDNRLAIQMRNAMPMFCCFFISSIALVMLFLKTAKIL